MTILVCRGGHRRRTVACTLRASIGRPLVCRRHGRQGSIYLVPRRRGCRRLLPIRGIGRAQSLLALYSATVVIGLVSTVIIRLVVRVVVRSVVRSVVRCVVVVIIVVVIVFVRHPRPRGRVRHLHRCLVPRDTRRIRSRSAWLPRSTTSTTSTNPIRLPVRRVRTRRLPCHKASSRVVRGWLIARVVLARVRRSRGRR